jgi:hypothetical protein
VVVVSTAKTSQMLAKPTKKSLTECARHERINLLSVKTLTSTERELTVMSIFSRKVVYSGTMSVDPAEVRRWEEAAAISGKTLHIPGGANPTSYLKDQVAQGNREAAEFRKQISRELDEMRAAGGKPNKKEAEKRARKWMASKFGWKK